MSADTRIQQYADATAQMIEGRFNVPISAEGDDVVGRLGGNLAELGRTLDRRFSEIQSLGQVTEQANAGLLLDEVLTHVYEAFRAVIPYDRIGFSLLEDDGGSVRARWARSESPSMKIVQGFAQPLAGSSLQRIIDTGEPRILNDLVGYLAEHPKSASTKLIVEEGMRSSLTCPLVVKGRPIGFMFFSSMQPGTYEHAHREVFMQIAGQLALIVEKSRLYQQLVELNELKDTFLGAAAHDLRSPLSAIQGFLDLMLMGVVGELTEQQTDLMGRMRRSSEGMLRLINDLLDVAAIESGKLRMDMVVMDPTACLEECVGSAKALAQAKDITVTLTTEGSLPSVPMDPQRIEQVMTNLVTNAIKFSESRTTIRLHAAASSAGVVVSVADEGQGIPEDELPQLFKDFARTSVRPTAGESSTGLGLAIVKRIVEAHGGEVGVESREGEGATFSFTLPTLSGAND